MVMIAGSAGVWLFFVQHQFEDVYWESGERWSYADAALQGSSYLKLPQPLQFFTGNIGLHHVHHLNARVPNYNLQAAHDGLPVFADVPVLTMRESFRCSRLKLIDERTRPAADLQAGAPAPHPYRRAACADARRLTPPRRRGGPAAQARAWDDPRVSSPPAPPKPPEMARTERVLPGIWRLRLPCPWPGVPHVNAWALAAGDGVVLFDTGSAARPRRASSSSALRQAGFSLRDVRLLVCTHSHSDHYGAAGTVVDAAGCELWMHPAWGHIRGIVEDPDGAWDRRIEVARQSGVPRAALEAYEKRRDEPPLVDRLVEPDRELVDGVEVETDAGSWRVYETPGHAPSHVILHQPERRLMISGDHLLGRVSVFFDYGHTPDPVGEFLASLERVARPRHGPLPGRPRPALPRDPGEDRGQPGDDARPARRGPRLARAGTAEPPSRSSRTCSATTTRRRRRPGACSWRSPTSTTCRQPARPSAAPRASTRSGSSRPRS